MLDFRFLFVKSIVHKKQNPLIKNQKLLLMPKKIVKQIIARFIKVVVKKFSKSEFCIRFDIVHTNLSEPALHLAVLVESQVNHHKSKLVKPDDSTWSALVSANYVFRRHESYVEEVFNIKRKIPTDQLDAIAKSVYTTLWVPRVKKSKLKNVSMKKHHLEEIPVNTVEYQPNLTSRIPTHHMGAFSKILIQKIDIRLMNEGITLPILHGLTTWKHLVGCNPKFAKLDTSKLSEDSLNHIASRLVKLVRDNHTPLSLPQEHSESIKKKEEVLV
jgi:hypothetical protein